MVDFFISLSLQCAILIKVVDGLEAAIVLTDYFRGITEESFLSVFGVAINCLVIALGAV